MATVRKLASGKYNVQVGATGVWSGTDLVANVVRIHAAPGS